MKFSRHLRNDRADRVNFILNTVGFGKIVKMVSAGRDGRAAWRGITNTGVMIVTDEQKESNRQKSKVRSRVEHVFGFMEQTMGGLIFRGVGMIRAKANIAMTNLVYNMCRLVQIKKYQPNLIAIQ